MKPIFVVLLFIASYAALAQELTQTVTGKIIDHETEEPLPFVNVYVKDSNPLIGGITDADGNFWLENVPIGRINVEISFMGYETLIVPEVVVSSAKMVQLTIRMVPTFDTLNEVVISPKTNKQKPINSTATVSARMFSVEEASRYAGGFDDPARLASSFAGVASSSGSDNAIVVRGNSPKFLQWNIEGVEIPNPNHFANLNSFGGGGLTALSSNLMANSDFMTGAFPAEYHNALAGVFDIKMRTGNHTDFEHSFEVGLIGIDLTSEGPLNKKTNASYLVNYRYSTLALLSSLLPKEAEGIQYQDLSFKLHFPTASSGTFSVWGIGLIDGSGTSPETDRNKQQYYQDLEDQDVNQYMGSVGLNHKFFFDNGAHLNSTLAFSCEGLDLTTDRLYDQNTLLPENRIESKRYNLTLKSHYNRRFSDQLFMRTGISVQGLGYDINIKEANGDNMLQDIAIENGFKSLWAGYAHVTWTKKKLRFNLGVATQLFTLNQHYTIEPRIGVSYQWNNHNRLSMGYGLHSRLEPLQVYFANTADSDMSQANKKLDFTKAHHFVLSYDWNIGPKTQIRVEPYYQALFDVPIAKNSNESLLNLQGDWFVTTSYFNTGKGHNYGIDVSLEQYIHHGFYYLVSGSVFNSEYRTRSSNWFNTRYNKNFLFNALVGKEFKIGRKGQNTLGLNLRVSVQGGDRYSKIDETASALAMDVVYDETFPFSEQAKPSTVIHTTFNYQWNKNKTTHRVSLKILNANGYKDFLGHRYNILTNTVEEYREALVIPNISYKILF